MTYEDLSALSPVVRREVLTGELQRRIKTMDVIPPSDADAVVDALIGLSLADVVDAIQEPSKLTEQVQHIHNVLTHKPQEPKEHKQRSLSKSPSPSASQDSRLLDPNALNATASAPEHPSTPVSLSASSSPRTSSPAGGAGTTSLAGASGTSERDRLLVAVGKLEPSRSEEITELLMSLSKRERAMCLFNVEVLRAKVADAKGVLDVDDEGAEPPTSAPAQVPVTPVRKTATTSQSLLEDSPRTPDLSSRGPSAAASPTAPTTPPSAPAIAPQTYTVETIARLPAAKIIEIITSGAGGSLGLSKADPMVVKATDEFIDSLAGQTVPRQKQALGDKLFVIRFCYVVTSSANEGCNFLIDSASLGPLD